MLRYEMGGHSKDLRSRRATDGAWVEHSSPPFRADVLLCPVCIGLQCFLVVFSSVMSRDHLHLRYPGCIFEVMRNGHIAGAVLFKG
jgi:hypothetical protein